MKLSKTYNKVCLILGAGLLAFGMVGCSPKDKNSINVKETFKAEQPEESKDASTEIANTDVTDTASEPMEGVPAVPSEYLETFYSESEYKDLTTEDARVAFGLYALNKRYGEEFKVASDEEEFAISSQDINLGDRTAVQTSIKVKSVNNTDFLTVAFVTNEGEEYDNYYICKYGDEIIEHYKSELSDITLPSEPEYELDTTPLTELYDNYKGYIDGMHIRCNLVTMVEEGKSVDEYAEIANKWMEALKSYDGSFGVRIELRMPKDSKLGDYDRTVFCLDVSSIENTTLEDVKSDITSYLELDKSLSGAFDAAMPATEE